MSNNKFLTWTHGIRLPQDARSPGKSRRKPLPLDFEETKQSSRTNDSMALQDAAVQSATSLLQVMNECLNNHLLSQHTSSTTLQPMHSRPRSRTAPSTPMAEAPAPPLAELEGSLPYQKISRVICQSVEGKRMRGGLSPSEQSMEAPSEHPHSNPQELHYKFPVFPHQSFDRSSPGLSPFPPADIIPRSKTESPHRKIRQKDMSMLMAGEDTLVAPETDTVLTSLKRPSMDTLSPRHRKLSPISRISHADISQIAASNSLNTNEISSDRTDKYAGLEVVWLEQISAMRAAHEAQVTALKEIHQRDIASHRSYIEFLEKRQAKVPTRQASKGYLTIDTSNGSQKTDLMGSEASATGSQQSLDSFPENRKHAPLEVAAETEALKRKLSLCKKAQAELGDVRQERDHLRDANEQNDRRIAQLKDLGRKAKENEKSLQNCIDGLEAALLAANNERLDVLEGFYEAMEHVRKVSERENLLIKERDELRGRLYYADPGWVDNTSAIRRQNMDDDQKTLYQKSSTLRNDPILQQIDHLRQVIAEKDGRIRELETGDKREPSQPTGPPIERDETTDSLKKQLQDAQADRDRYNNLLHTELRRHTKSVVQRSIITTPQLEKEASALLTRRLRADSALNGAQRDQLSTSGISDIPSQTLERELKHCIQEIILYKLDIKGYKKDLKNAVTEIDSLRIIANSGRQRSSSHQHRSSPNRHARRPSENGGSKLAGPGLGIVWPQQPPSTPEKSVTPATTTTLLSARSTPHILSAISPRNPMTPLSTQKKLPKPPPDCESDTPSPGPVHNLHPRASSVSINRQSTLRSLSESIISSYAKRTPEQGTFPKPQTPQPPRGRSSEPPRPRESNQLNDTAVPIMIGKNATGLIRMVPFGAMAANV